VGGRFPRWLTRSLNAGLITPLVKKPPAEGQTPDARPTNARDADVTLPLKAIQRKATPALRRLVGPQQLGVGVKNGVELKILGMKILADLHKAEGSPFVVVLVDLKNAHNAYDRNKAQTALDEAAAAEPELRDIARAHHADCGQASDIYMRTADGRGFTHICEGTAGGPQGSPITNGAFPVVINSALKSTEAGFGVDVKAIQDDCAVMGDPEKVFGPNGGDGALHHLLENLKEVNLDSVPTKFQCYTVNTDPSTIPPGIPRPFHITDPVLRAQVCEKEAAAAAAEEAARSASTHEKESAEQEAKTAKATAIDARKAVPEELRAYGIVTCGAAVGDDEFVTNFLHQETDRITSRIRDTATSLTAESAQAGQYALRLSLQNRADHLLATHLPKQTRDLAKRVEETLGKGRQQAYGMDLQDTTPTWAGQRDPEFTRDQAYLRIRDGGVGLRDTLERQPFLSTMCNIAPAIAGDADQPSMWPSLRDKAFGPNLLQLDTAEGGWTFFFGTGCPMAMELASCIGQVKGLYNQASQDAGDEQVPENAVLGAPDNIFGIGVEKPHKQFFDAIRAKRAEAQALRAKNLPRDDQRGVAFIQSSGDPVSNALFSSPLNKETALTNTEF